VEDARAQKAGILANLLLPQRLRAVTRSAWAAAAAGQEPLAVTDVLDEMGQARGAYFHRVDLIKFGLAALC